MKSTCHVSLLFFLLSANLLCGPSAGFAQNNLADERLSSTLNAKRIELLDEQSQAWIDGKLSQSLAACHQILTVEKELFGPDDDRVAETFYQMTAILLELDDIDAARVQFSEYYRIYTTAHPKESWQAVEAERKVAVFQKFVDMGPDRRQEFFDAQREYLQQSLANRYDLAVAAIRKSAVFLRESFGERDPDSIVETCNMLSLQISIGEDLDVVGRQLSKLYGVLKQVEHPRHPNIGSVLFTLSRYAEETGDSELALRFASEALSILKESPWNPDYPWVATQYGDLLYAAGEYRQSLDPFRQALYVRGAENVSHAKGDKYINESLCAALQTVAAEEAELHNFESARELLAEAYDVALQSWGADDVHARELQFDLDLIDKLRQLETDQLRAFDQLMEQETRIISRREEGDYRSAIQLAKRRYAGMTELFGPTTVATLRARYTLLSLKMYDPDVLHDFEEMRAEAIELIELYGKHLGTQHVEYAEICFETAEYLGSNDPLGIHFVRIAIEAYEKALTTASVEYVVALTLLGEFLVDVNDPEAKTVLQDAVQRWEVNVARGCYRHCVAAHQLGSFYYSRGFSYEARPVIARAVALFRECEEDVDIELACALNSLGNLALDNNIFLDAIASYTEALSLFDKHPREDLYADAEDTLQWLLCNLGQAYYRNGDAAEAEPVLKRLLRDFPESPPPVQAKFLRGCYWLTKALVSLGNVEEAQPVLDRASAAVAEHYAQVSIAVMELSLEQADFAFSQNDTKLAQERLDAGFTAFRGFQTPDEIDPTSGNRFLNFVERLVEGYEAIDQWETALAVRKHSIPFYVSLKSSWAGDIASAKAEYAVAEVVAQLDADTLKRYKQVLADTERLRDAREHDYIGITQDITQNLEQQLITVLKTCSEITKGPESEFNLRGANYSDALTGYWEAQQQHAKSTPLSEVNLRAADYCDALSGYWESQQQYAKSVPLIVYSFQVRMKVFNSNHWSIAASGVRLGRAGRLSGAYSGSRQALDGSIRALTQFLGSQHLQVTKAKLELARLYVDTEDFATALPLAHEAVDYFRNLWGENHLDYAEATELLGFCYAGLNEPQLAQEYIAKSNRVFSRLLEPHRHRYLKSFANQAIASGWSETASDESRLLFEEAIRRYKEAELTHLMDFHELNVEYGDALRKWRDYADAERVYEAAISATTHLKSFADNVMRASTRARLGVTQRHLVKLDAALENLKAAEPIQRKRLGEQSQILSDTLYHLALVEHLLGDDDSARIHVVESLEIQQASIDKLGNLVSEKSLSAMLSGTETRLDLLLSIISQSDATGEHAELAFHWTLQRKGLALDLSCRLLALQQSQLLDKKTGRLADQVRMLNQQLADLSLQQHAERTVEQVAAERAKLNRQLTQAHSDLSLAFQASGIALDEINGNLEVIQQSLGDRVVLIEFVQMANTVLRDGKFVDESQYCAFLVTGGADSKVQFEVLGSVSEIDGMIDELREHTKQVPRLLRINSEADLEATFKELSHPLYVKLLEPFSEHLQDAKTIIFGPDAGLCRVAFAALVDDEGRYLIERADISYVSSSRDQLRTRGPPATGTLILSNPNFDADIDSRQQTVEQIQEQGPLRSQLAMRGREEVDVRGLRWKRLPGAEEEAIDTERLLGGSQYGPVLKFLGDEAVEEVLKTAQSPRILHLATHGFYVALDDSTNVTQSRSHSTTFSSGLSQLRTDANPLVRSGIVLAGANRLGNETVPDTSMQDGWVTAQEIAGMDFRNTELVVLSACESGLGDVSAGQGVQGIRRAFINAGAHSVLTSLFEVPDIETRELMRGFYEALLENPNRRTALSEAQRTRIKQRQEEYQSAHPFYWASFILLGAAE